MKTIKKLSAIMLVFAMLLSFVACGIGDAAKEVGGATAGHEFGTVSSGKDTVTRKDFTRLSDLVLNEGTLYDEIGNKDLHDTGAASPDVSGEPTVTPGGKYNEGIVLVKTAGAFNEADLGDLEYVSAEPLYKGSNWYSIRLSDTDKTEEAVAYLTELGAFAAVDYDYVMSAGTVEAIDVSSNPDYAKQQYLDDHKIYDSWQYAADNGRNPGGSSDVVVAVIDTGVDYSHLDLRNNIWINTAEIPGNGIDDDGNGYIDDVYGWNFVGDNNDPKDDNGHGTHVAGIIAAENNDIGSVGVAYNCKVMVLKAGNSSGYFNNSDIAEAIRYAYMNGASVINMSFGGSVISMAAKDALENAYNSCILVAAAGNDSACNNLSCKICQNVEVAYPAALPYVIGVMSTNHDGSRVSSFSNYDHYPYGSTEYEVYAAGEAIPSCWPGNRYAMLNGTSMAAPVVSGIAALLRSYYSDREVYSTKYIQSQIVNTGTRNPYNQVTESVDDKHTVANSYEALTRLPKPDVNLYDYYIDDSASISPANNGNGVIDAGEAVRLYFSLHNRGGVAGNVNVTINAERGEGLADPYFTFTNNALLLSDIGTYSVRESGDSYFEIIVSADCPNDYLTDFNIFYTYINGMDEKDTKQYSGSGKARFNVSSGYHLPSIISKDTVFTNDRLYIVGDDVTIPAGVTVTFEEGCEIQFYDDREYYSSPAITVYGTLNFNGSKDQMISIAPNNEHENFVCYIISDKVNDIHGMINIAYANTSNLSICKKDNSVLDEEKWFSFVTNSCLTVNSENLHGYSNGSISEPYVYQVICSIRNSYLESFCYSSLITGEMDGNCIYAKANANIDSINEKSFVNNIFYSAKPKTHSFNRPYSFSGDVSNNVFSSLDNGLESLIKFNFESKGTVSDNTFSAGYQKYASQVISNYIDSNGNPTVDVYGSCSDITKLWPYVVSMELFDADGSPVTTVGREEIKVRVTFNRPMDTTKNTFLTFGTAEPYGDYRIDGEYVSDTVWEGTYTLKAQIENGQNILKVNNACAAEDPTKTVFGEYNLHEFTIDTTAAMSMNLFANATDLGIELTLAQDDYDTLLGYNIYRSEKKDGNYVKLNPAILLPDELTFLDENAEPGKTYWYTYTVVLTDFTESNPAGRVQATANDTMAPTLYHTPVNQGYKDNNLVISCTASDNVAIASVTLYYRTTGSEAWKSLIMSKVNDKYNATIFGSELTLDGIEYYIKATDGVNTVYKGSAETPYTVVIKDASAISRIGDVDGNGQITTKDALMLMQCLNGDLILSDDEFKRADLNGDGQLSSAEALRILQYVNGKITTLEM